MSLIPVTILSDSGATSTSALIESENISTVTDYGGSACLVTCAGVTYIVSSPINTFKLLAETAIANPRRHPEKVPFTATIFITNGLLQVMTMRIMEAKTTSYGVFTLGQFVLSVPANAVACITTLSLVANNTSLFEMLPRLWDNGTALLYQHVSRASAVTPISESYSNNPIIVKNNIQAQAASYTSGTVSFSLTGFLDAA